ncbi:hypothetical protein PoB_005869300 [Plakobranchus ocellatus]|uniref:Uncharacterized protein n=1 Tax=Plakobranchus ocellatus TaxID=259542 RepID=A0AAV4CLU4_9GAST|nr:hypothetical protein PoB_005869300 [Plakobranchus ocellatus]
MQQKRMADAFLCSNLPSQYPPGILITSAPVHHLQYPPQGILKTRAPVRRPQYPPPGISKASAPVRHRQCPPPVLQSAITNNSPG